MEEKNLDPVGYSMKDFSIKTSLSIGLFYKLSEEQWPYHVKINGRLVITEPPSDWLKRVGR